MSGIVKKPIDQLLPLLRIFLVEELPCLFKCGNQSGNGEVDAPYETLVRAGRRRRHVQGCELFVDQLVDIVVASEMLPRGLRYLLLRRGFFRWGGMPCERK